MQVPIGPTTKSDLTTLQSAISVKWVCHEKMVQSQGWFAMSNIIIRVDRTSEAKDPQNAKKVQCDGRTEGLT